MESLSRDRPFASLHHSGCADTVYACCRNHKLTMLMSDSLGGSAKTLMFVNVSPTDHNIDESSNSLTYATRVRTIKNDISKNEASKDVMRLKRQVRGNNDPLLTFVVHMYWLRVCQSKPETFARLHLHTCSSAPHLCSLCWSFLAPCMCTS